MNFPLPSYSTAAGLQRPQSWNHSVRGNLVERDFQGDRRSNWTTGVPLRPRCERVGGKGRSALSVDGEHHQRRSRHLRRRTPSDGNEDFSAIAKGGHQWRPRMAKEPSSLLVHTVHAVAACVDGDGELHARVGGSGRLSNLGAPMRRRRGEQAVRMEAAERAEAGAVPVGGWPVDATTTGWQRRGAPRCNER